MGKGRVDLVNGSVHGEAAVGVPHHFLGRVFHPGLEADLSESIPGQRILLSRWAIIDFNFGRPARTIRAEFRYLNACRNQKKTKEKLSISYCKFLSLVNGGVPSHGNHAIDGIVDRDYVSNQRRVDLKSAKKSFAHTGDKSCLIIWKERKSENNEGQ